MSLILKEAITAAGEARVHDLVDKLALAAGKAISAGDAGSAMIYLGAGRELLEPGVNYSALLMGDAATDPDAAERVVLEMFATAADTGDELILTLARELGSAAWATKTVQRDFAADLERLDIPPEQGGEW